MRICGAVLKRAVVLSNNGRMDETERLARRSLRLVRVACILSLGAFFCSGLQVYFTWTNNHSAKQAAAPSESIASQNVASDTNRDARVDLSLQELIRRSPPIRSGNLQAWWAGEQARNVVRLEAQAKRQLLAGDRDGAARTIARADAIRAEIPTLADSEKPQR
ncbi:MAG: hypothetical protein M3R10_08035 [Verrucomicrobiota bacterium]|nr:hypothetical protein [Verrucomicrobiota bacterium]